MRDMDRYPSEVLASEVRDYLAGIGRRGGVTTLERHGLQKMKVWAARGGRARAQKHSPEQLREWARRGGRPRKALTGEGSSSALRP